MRLATPAEDAVITSIEDFNPGELDDAFWGDDAGGTAAAATATPATAAVAGGGGGGGGGAPLDGFFDDSGDEDELGTPDGGVGGGDAGMDNFFGDDSDDGLDTGIPCFFFWRGGLFFFCLWSCLLW